MALILKHFETVFNLKPMNGLAFTLQLAAPSVMGQTSSSRSNYLDTLLRDALNMTPDCSMALDDC